MRLLLPVGVVLSLLLVGVASACVVIPRPPPRPDIPPLYLQCKSQHVEVTIVDQVARVTVTTELHNPHAQQVEGTFLFPVPAGASVGNFSYWIGDKEMKGELLDRDKARQVYEDIVRKMRDPALLEYDGGSLFKASIFPIPGGGDAKTKLQYTLALKGENGVVRFLHAVKLGRTNPNHGKLIVDVSIKSKQAIKSVYSPTHKIDVTRKGDNEVRAGLELDDTDFNADFELIYTLAEKDFGVNVLTHRPAGENGYFMMLLAPKQEWAEQEIEGKDVVFTLDTSGSMSGEKIEQVKKAFTYCLNSLKPKDRFGLLTFSTDTRLFEDKLLPADPDNIKRAKDFVGKIEAAGATALNDALVQSVELFGKGSDRPRMMIFLTDGLPTAGERDLEQIIKNVAKANHTGGDDKAADRVARLFVFGVGDDVNTHLLDRVADGNAGSSNYVRPQEDIEAAVSSLYSKLSHPVLSNIELKMTKAEPLQMYPQKLPDLFVGSQLVVTGRYEGSGESSITLSGMASGKETVYEYTANFPKETDENVFVARVWAGRRVGYLLDQIRLNGEDKELKDEVVKLAIKFGIVTPYTSYLVQEDKDLTRNAPLAQRAFGGAAGAPGMPGAIGPQGPAGPAPAPATLGATFKADRGAGAVHAAQSTQALKDATQQEGRYQGYQQVARRTFYQNGEMWVDTTWQQGAQQGTKVLQVKAFSQAYFDLLQARPDLAPYLAMGNQVQVQLARVGIQVGPEGLETLTADQLEELKK
jgi:Ca-activated chloride channel homolog